MMPASANIAAKANKSAAKSDTLVNTAKSIFPDFIASTNIVKSKWLTRDWEASEWSSTAAKARRVGSVAAMPNRKLTKNSHQSTRLRRRTRPAPIQTAFHAPGLLTAVSIVIFTSSPCRSVAASRFLVTPFFFLRLFPFTPGKRPSGPAIASRTANSWRSFSKPRHGRGRFGCC